MRFTYHSKGIARVSLRELLEDFETAGRSLAHRILGIDLIFRVPSKMTDAQMLAIARSFAQQAPTYEAAFKARLGNDYLTELQAAIDAFENSMTPPEEAESAQVEATASLGEAVRQGMIARRVLRSIMKLKYKNNPARMAAWQSASRIERSGKKEEETPAPTP